MKIVLNECFFLCKLDHYSETTPCIWKRIGTHKKMFPGEKQRLSYQVYPVPLRYLNLKNFDYYDTMNGIHFYTSYAPPYKKSKKGKRKSRECHNHKSQPFPDPKRKPTNLNKHKPNKRTKSTKISSLFPKRGNRNTKRTEKHGS